MNFCPNGGALILGNEVLAEADPDYTLAARKSAYRVPRHTVQRVITTLIDRSPRLPLGWTVPPSIERAVDVIIGYLLLDALCG
jgi:hypothetical protein